MKLNDPKKYSLSELFKNFNYKIINIPPYQRKYSWGMDQWSKLTDNIDELLQELIDNVDKDINDIYYMGTLIFHNDNNKGEINIVDGQQRIVTYLILTSAFYDFYYNKIYLTADEEDKNHLVKQAFENILFLPPQKIYEKNKNRVKTHRIKLHEKDMNIYKSVISNENKYSNFKLSKAKVFFNNWLNEKNKEELEVLTQILLEKLNIILITINEIEDVFVLFESINDTGLKLTVADLLKNLLIRSYQKYEVDQQKLDNFASDWSIKIEEPLGTNIDKFLLHYFISKYGKNPQKEIFPEESVSIKNLFKFYKSAINDIDNNLTDWLQDFYDAAKFYSAIINKNNIYSDEIINNFSAAKKTFNLLNDFKTLRIQQIYPFILSLKPYKFTKNTEFENTNKDLTILLNYLFRTIIIKGKSPSHVEREIYELVEKNIEGKSINLESKPFIVKESLEIADFANLLWKNAFESYRLKYIQTKYCDNIIPHGVNLDSNLELEHIFPQNPSSEWKNDSDWKEVIENEELNEDILKCIGNSTLINPTKNKKAGNSIWEKKRQAYNQDKTWFCFESDETLKSLPIILKPKDIQQRSINIVEYLINNKVFAILENEKEISFDTDKNEFVTK
ncbi:hypothetical protein SSYRP_v1c07100 [Spiroplasma syrphidicola EA-1]|uniref:DUF262 domain-containing protein n=1 Tax=Spiroplasma syrphidicola EA-1 TaxID=1276229 RepID=R4UJI9_9MOLU|nr:DUF262 domain-containing protein [Spiroplasma syrphidicola]AGM26300.1 hypothetical protein SSYRP_v1c07100 [Spiroplasma syrphidicola EA-1]